MILFNSFFLGGFECSTHSRPNGTRLDLIAATGHDQFAELDYERLKAAGILACRDGLRWHLIERVEKQFDFSSAIPMIRAARRAGMQVIWDLFHYGWPDGLDIFSPQFVDRFARFARESARIIVEENEEVPWFVVINEPSFLCWAGGQEAFFPPFERGRSHELKMQLIRASIVATDAVRDVAPDARFIQVDPIINIVSDPNASQEMRRQAANYRQAQFHCWDMLAGYDCPELGGGPHYIDVIGCNYYVHNQWVYNGSFIERTDPRYRPLEDMLAEVQERYGRPILLAETGIEEERRPEWLSYISDELLGAMQRGVQLEGACLYPILNHPGWDNDRHCKNGLWDYCNHLGHREIYSPLALELRAQQRRMEAVRASFARDRKLIGVFA